MTMKPDWDELIAPLLDLSRRCDEMFDCLAPGRRWYEDVNEHLHRLEVAIDWEIARLQWEERSFKAYQRDMAREWVKAERQRRRRAIAAVIPVAAE